MLFQAIFLTIIAYPGGFPFQPVLPLQTFRPGPICRLKAVKISGPPMSFPFDGHENGVS